MASKNPHMPALPQSNLALDILMGRDETIEPADIFGGTCILLMHDVLLFKTRLGMERGPSTDIHRDMEKKLRL
jgi:proteasome maturation protein